MKVTGSLAESHHTNPGGEIDMHMYVQQVDNLFLIRCVERKASLTHGDRGVKKVRSMESQSRLSGRRGSEGARRSVLLSRVDRKLQ